MEIKKILYDGMEGSLSGPDVEISVRRLRDLKGFFQDEEAYQAMDSETLLYETVSHIATRPIEGGLYFGVTHLYPGKVGREYYMTKGHFHLLRNRAEYYWGIKGTGLLLLMDEGRDSWVEEVFPGSLHYIPGFVAHRLVNTGNEKLVVGACWPSDAGHDYDTVLRDGFSLRILDREGQVVLQP